MALTIVLTVALIGALMLAGVACAAMAGHRIGHQRAADALADSRSETARERDLRVDYERALGLPFWSRAQTEQALMARAVADDEVASEFLRVRLEREIDDAAGIEHAHGVVLYDRELDEHER